MVYYYKLKFTHQCKFLTRSDYLHEDMHNCILLASTGQISKDRKKTKNVPPVSVYFCLQLVKAEHWHHWVGNLGLSLGCYLMCQLKTKKHH
jgi:hypothetical protein